MLLNFVVNISNRTGNVIFTCDISLCVVVVVDFTYRHCAYNIQLHSRNHC